MTKLLLLGEITEDLKQLLKSGGYEHSADTNKTDYEGIIVRGGVQVDDKLMSKLPDLKLVISAGIGVDNIDLNYAADCDILVANCPFASAVTTAEHSVALLMAATKKIAKADTELKSGVWERSENMTTELYGKRVAVIGLGRIGSHVAQLYRSLGMNVVGFDPLIHPYSSATRGVEQAQSLEQAVEGANFISLHVSKIPETLNLITKKHVLKMAQPNGVINTCRGGVISEDLVEELLDAGKLGFYAADVFETEPQPRTSLVNRKNVVVTPHIAANSNEAQKQIAQDTIAQLDDHFKQQTPPKYLVNN